MINNEKNNREKQNSVFVDLNSQEEITDVEKAAEIDKIDELEKFDIVDKLDDVDDELKLDNKDILAMIIALFQLLIPFVIGLVVIYFIIMLFITGVWLA